MEISVLFFAAFFQIVFSQQQQQQPQQQQPSDFVGNGMTGAQMWNPSTWTMPYYVAASQAWTDYLKKAQEASNQLYKQWDMTGAGNLYNTGLGFAQQAGSQAQQVGQSAVDTTQQGAQTAMDAADKGTQEAMKQGKQGVQAAESQVQQFLPKA